MIPYGRQSINEKDIQAVEQVLRSDWLTQGPVLQKFEQEVADYCGATYAVAVNSATSALHLACLAAGLQQGDYFWTSPNTFVASANCGIYCGATIDFLDIDAKTYNMNPDLVAEKLIQAEQENRLPKVIIPVHFSGQSCAMQALAKATEKYDLTIIEDASHAIGSTYQGHKVGCCQYSDMTVFSFHPVKIITSGEGGMIVTNNKELYEKLLLLRTHGIIHQSGTDPWYYEQVDLGFNYRLTDIQAALGRSQLTRIDAFVHRRRQLAQVYHNLLKDLALILPYQTNQTDSSWHLYVIQTEKRKQVFEHLRKADIKTNVHYIPVHTQPYYQRLGFRQGDFPVAEQYYAKALTLPLYYDLTEEEQNYIVTQLKEVLK